MSSRPLHINTLIHNIISLLKRYDDGLSFERLKSLLNLDILSLPELVSRLKNNPRVVFLEDRLMYRPLYDIKNADDLVQYFQKYPNGPGVLLSELKESYKTVETELHSSALNGIIYKVPVTNQSQAILYYNMLPNVKAAPEDVKMLWSNINPSSLNFSEI